MKVDYNNCILNVTSSIMRKFNVESKHQSLAPVDVMIKDAKHVFFVVLDGLGKNIIEKHLNENSFIRSNIYRWIHSVYPPTTVAATTAAITGEAPGVTGWVGWHQYFDAIKKDVVLFRNVTQYTEEVLTVNVGKTFIPTTPFYQKFTNASCRELFPKFREGGFKTFKDMGEEMVKISKSNELTYTYCYWDNPDYMIHEYGTEHKKVRKIVNDLDKELNRIFNKCGEGTAIIMIADHGLVDTTEIYLNDYPDLVATLEFEPSIEGRTTAFKVRDKKLFEILFNKYFAKDFKLYKSEDFLKEGYLGCEYEVARPYLLDYVSVAIGNYALALEKGDFVMKATHAGDTYDEIIIPLVLLKK